VSKQGSLRFNYKGSQDVMLRKVQRLGASSLIVTLPRNWARRHSLKVGDYIYIYDEGDKLIMSPTSNGRSVSLTLDLRHTSNLKHLGKTCLCGYIFGFDSVNFHVSRSTKLVREKLDMLTSLLSEGVSISQVSHNMIAISFKDDMEFFDALKEYTRRSSMFIRRVHDILERGCRSREVLEGEYNDIRILSYKLLRLANKKVYIDSREDRLGKILLNIANLTSLAATATYTLALDATELYELLDNDEREKIKFLLGLLEVTMATIGSAIDPPSTKKAEDTYWKIKNILNMRENIKELVSNASSPFIYMLGRIIDIAHVIEYITASIICYTIMNRALAEEQA